jgi:hypothetical protein
MRARSLKTTLLTTGLFCAALVAPARAQKWEQQQIGSVGIELRVPDTLRVSPVQFEDGDRQALHLKYEFKSIDVTSHEGSNFPKDGSIRVLVFPKKPSDEEKRDRRFSRNFEDFVRNNQVYKGERTFHIEGEEQKGRGKTPDHDVWEYSEAADLFDGKDPITHYHVAATYDFEDRQVAVVYDFWAFDNRPDRGTIRNGRTIVESVVPTEIVDVGSQLKEDPRARKADTPAKLACLEVAAKSILGAEGWDFTTTDEFIVLYSHDGGPKQRKAQKIAEEYADTLAAMRAKFREDWPVEDRELPYPTLRVCHERRIYSTFGSNGAPLGRFVPETAEVVIFDDSQGQVGSKDAVRQTMIAAAWQQYAASYWPGVEFQRWWMLGTSDYYAQYEPKGRKLQCKPISNPYVYFELEEGRFRLENPIALVEGDLRDDAHVPLRDFVRWESGKFDGARPANHRAQAYAFVDFLARGPEKLGRRFEENWAGLWRAYPQKMAETKSTSKTIEKVFDGVDFAALEDAWKDWVKRSL